MKKNNTFQFRDVKGRDTLVIGLEDHTNKKISTQPVCLI